MCMAKVHLPLMNKFACKLHGYIVYLFFNESQDTYIESYHPPDSLGWNSLLDSCLEAAVRRLFTNRCETAIYYPASWPSLGRL